VTIGILVASIVNAIIVELTEGATQWHLALAIQCGPGALLVLIMFFMPNSPRWLLDKGKDNAALGVLAKLRASPQKSVIVQTEYQEIKNGIIAERAIGNAAWSELWSPGIFNRLVIAILLQTFQQWTGINIILYYAGDLFAKIVIFC
jgi:SP family sugar:H+ symporter-like MFS transporter